MRPSTEPQAAPLPLFQLDRYLALLDDLLPRLLTQIDRDPHSPTFGSCDRHFWMYRLHDFDSGVLQQASLSLAALVRLAESGAFEGRSLRHLSAAEAPYWRALALAINRRNGALLARNGLLDEYYPGERSYPGTVFTAHATLRSALLLGQTDIAAHPGLRRTAEALRDRQPSPAANQDIAAAAFLALYAQARGFEPAAVAATVTRLLREPAEAGGGVRRQEYGGADLGYATVSLNYLGHLVESGSHDAAGSLAELGAFIARFVGTGGRLGGEFPSRATAYFLPFGAVLAAEADPTLAARLGTLDPAAAMIHLDDRYLMHYCLPSLACAALRLFERGAPAIAAPEPGDAAARGWLVADERALGLLAARRGDLAVFVGLHKGASLQVERAGRATIDCGWRVARGGETYATCVVDAAPKVEIHRSEDRLEIAVEAPFARYRTLVASPMKTLVLRLIRFLGPTFNAYFKSRLIKDAQALPGARLRRRLVLDLATDTLQIADTIDGLAPGDVLTPAPAASLRLVPSAKLHQPGEGAAFLRAATPEARRQIERSIALREL